MSDPIDEWECDSCEFITSNKEEYDMHTETHVIEE